ARRRNTGMHAGLRTKLGVPLANEVIDVLAPLERGELAERFDFVELKELYVGIRGDFVELTARVDKLEATLSGRIDKLDARFDKLDAKVDALIPKFIWTNLAMLVAVVAILLGARLV